jgi:alkyl sulfatase BDS1-like metallo-beta-lactamase superfamily hydrolase
VAVSAGSPDTVRGMADELLLDVGALRLDRTQTGGMKTAIRIKSTDLSENWPLAL